MTDILGVIVAFVTAGVMNLIVVSRIRAWADPLDSRFLVRVYTWAVSLRYALALVLNMVATDSAIASTFWGDSDTYDFGGHLLSLKWSGEPVAVIELGTGPSGYGWTYFIGSVYYLFGRNQLLVQLLNGLLSGVTALVIYAITVQLFDRNAGRKALLFMAFFPQMVFWSTGMYKDPTVLLCIAVSMYSVLSLRRRLSPLMVILFGLAVLVLVTVRFYIAYFVVFATVAAFVFAEKRSVLRMAVTYVLLAAFLYGALTFAVAQEMLEQQSTYATLERLQVTRSDQAMWARSGYGQEHDVSTPAGALAALPVGLAYLLFAPFPWAVSGLRQVLILPETLAWYALMPAFARGLASGLRKRFRGTLPIAVFAISLTLAYALMQGNVGTAYRQRTQVTMFFFIFMAVGIAERKTHPNALRPLSRAPTPSR